MKIIIFLFEMLVQMFQKLNFNIIYAYIFLDNFLAHFSRLEKT